MEKTIATSSRGERELEAIKAVCGIFVDMKLTLGEAEKVLIEAPYYLKRYALCNFDRFKCTPE